MSEEIRGDVPLHDRHATGLFPEAGNIWLYGAYGMGFMVGVDIVVNTEAYHGSQSGANYMTLQSVELAIPSGYGNYVWKMNGWVLYQTSGYNYYRKPKELRLQPHHPEYTTFAFLDAHGETDPYFTYAWGRLVDHLPPIGTTSRKCIARLGVNYPVADDIKPSWTDVPPQIELWDILQPAAPSGEWTLKADVTGFSASDEVNQPAFINVLVWQGQRRYHHGQVGYIVPGAYSIGASNAHWEGITWGSTIEKGSIRMLSGNAAGVTLTVTGSFYTGDNPPPGYPPNMWFVYANYGPLSPGMLGILPGDEFMLCSPYSFTEYKLLSYHEDFSVGNHQAQQYVFTFTPVM